MLVQAPILSLFVPIPGLYVLTIPETDEPQEQWSNVYHNPEARIPADPTYSHNLVAAHNNKQCTFYNDLYSFYEVCQQHVYCDSCNPTFWCSIIVSYCQISKEMAWALTYGSFASIPTSPQAMELYPKNTPTTRATGPQLPAAPDPNFWCSIGTPCF